MTQRKIQMRAAQAIYIICSSFSTHFRLYVLFYILIISEKTTKGDHTLNFRSSFNQKYFHFLFRIFCPLAAAMLLNKFFVLCNATTAPNNFPC